MAIVIRSERDFKLSENSSGIIGPGEYDKEENISLENIPQNQAPFNVKSERNFNFSKNINPDIGPGSYYNPKKRYFINKSFNKNNSSLETLNKKDLYNLALFKIVNGKKEIKLKEQKYLIINKENINQVYNINNNKKNININDKKIYYKLIPTTLTHNRINSIPSKQYNLGYDFDENGLPIMVDSSTIVNDGENEKNNILNKKIKAIDWSKMSKKIICSDNEYPITTKDNTIINNSSKISKEIKGTPNDTTNSSLIQNIRKSSSNKSNSIRINNNLNKVGFNPNDSLTSLSNNNINNDLIPEKNLSIYKSLSNEHNNNYNYKKISKIKGNLYKTINKDYYNKNKLEDKLSLEDFVYKNLFKGEPGPGYYQEYSDFDKYKHILLANKKIKYNFGSNEKKNKYLYKSGENMIGPGHYFKEANTPRIKASFFPLSRREENFNIKKYEKEFIDENIGPGKYDIKSQFDKTQIYYSGPLEKRFFDNKKKIGPGPGEYLQLLDWEKKNDVPVQKLKVLNDEKKNENEKKEEKGRHDYILKNDNPGVGEYNPHIINSIKYNIISKDNKISNLIAPFSSGQEKYLKKSSSTSDILGPGSYFPNINLRNNIFKKIENKSHLYKKDEIKKDNIKLFDNQIKLNIENQIGPGTYELQKYTDWNKKSFNVLYV